jgi:hypothetical protein
MRSTKQTRHVTETTGLRVTLSVEEASVLAAIMYAVGGAPKGPRGVCDKFAAELRTVTPDPDETRDLYEVNGYITIQAPR